MTATRDDPITVERLRAFELFSELDDADLLVMVPYLTPKSFAAGEPVFRQGRDADSAFFLERGELEVLSALPGGDEVIVARVTPGATLGETSLVRSGVRVASVRARTAASGFEMHRRFLQGAIAQFHVSAFRILRQIRRMVSARLRSLYSHMLAMDRAGRIPATGRLPYSPGPRLADITPAPCPFDHRRFVSRLKFFSEFPPDEFERLESRMRLLELARGTVLFESGDVAGECFFVVRGALELCIVRDRRRVPLAILGPGSLCGTTEVTGDTTRLVHGLVREPATVYRMEAEALRGLLTEETWPALKLQLALCESLVVDLGKINKRLARLVSHAAIHENRHIESVLDEPLLHDGWPPSAPAK